ncbi:MAG: hypothetical protein H0T83_09820 [Chthoniobacterales bacterium]|nr:hypothetical protein [Chthoniobacterales bacterium]
MLVDYIGKLRIGPGGILKGSGTISATEILLAGGTSEFNGSQGLPGNSPGTLTLEGNFTQEFNSRLVMESAGLDPGEFDVLHVTGDATLGGTLELQFSRTTCRKPVMSFRCSRSMAL